MVNRARSYVNRKRIPDNGTPTLAETLARATKRLRRLRVEAPELQAQLLLAHVLRISRARLLAELRQPLRSGPRAVFWRLVKRRCQRAPLQYLLGREDFGGLTLRVGPGVLIPRPETELLLQEALRRAQPQAGDSLADLGTGSGNLGLALALRFPLAKIYATDVSTAALRWARLNRRRLGARNLRLLRGQAHALIPKSLHGRFILVVSNPPYIPTRQLSRLQPEVRREPRSALDGGPDGLDGLRQMLSAALQLLSPAGVFAAEIGIGQARAAHRLFADAGFTSIQFLHDWNKIPRVVSGLAPASPKQRPGDSRKHP